MLTSYRHAIAENFGPSAIRELREAIREKIIGRFEIPVGAICLAAALSVLDGYPRLFALSLTSLCSFVSLVRERD